MKKMKLAAIAAIVTLASCISQEKNIAVSIDGWQAFDSVSVYHDFYDGNHSEERVPLKRGRAEFDISGEEPQRIVVTVPKDEDMGYILFSTVIETVVSPNDHVEIQGSVDPNGVLRYETTGAPVAEELNRLRNEFLPSRAREDSLQRLLIIDQYEGLATGEGDRIYAEQSSLYSARQTEERARMLEFISANPDHEASAWFATLLPFAISKPSGNYPEHFELLSDSVLVGEYKPWLDARLKQLRELEIRVAAMQTDLTTTPAPARDFTLKDIDNNEVTLSKLANDKYIVLDFWGSWCVPCIEGMPRMKELYAAYSDRVEIVSIACNDDEQRWRDAVAKLELPWINLLNDEEVTENNVPVHYGIGVFPTKFIISPDKKILHKFQGESDDFYIKIEELLK
jgi:thiol-disulfide isomerase/thioredoxin